MVDDRERVEWGGGVASVVKRVGGGKSRMDSISLSGLCPDILARILHQSVRERVIGILADRGFSRKWKLRIWTSYFARRWQKLAEDLAEILQGAGMVMYYIARVLLESFNILQDNWQPGVFPKNLIGQNITSSHKHWWAVEYRCNYLVVG